MNEELLGAVRAKSAVLVAGTGLSVSASNGSEFASWLGLLEAGISRITKLGARGGDWATMVRSMISLGADASDTSFIVQAASQVGNVFRQIGDVAYTRWLEETVGTLRPVDPSLANALCELPIPLLTTNYDTLLEQVSDRHAVTWRQPGEMQRILSNRSRDIGHLHGVWNDPDSVILSAEDYEGLLASEAAQAIQMALGASRSIVYVGVGGGLSDPNFVRFLEWQRTTFPNPGLRHFRLCTTSESPGLLEQHRADNVDVVIYGDDHHDLVPYLTDLNARLSDIAVSTSGLLLDAAGEVRLDFLESLKSEVIVGQNYDNDSVRSLEDLVLPPVLLPVPHAQYVTTRLTVDAPEALERLDPEDDLLTGDIVLIVGEENSGLSFTAKWLAYRSSEVRPQLAPLYINFTQCRRVAKPLSEGIKQSMRVAGLSIGKKDLIPPLALVLDDFSPYVEKISDRVVHDLSELADGFAVVTCKQGTEEDVKRKLEAAGLRVRLRYVGKLERHDIETLARVVAPVEFKRLADAVITLLKSEHLPRTPYTVSQLLFILLKSGALSANASSTSILEEYVSLLLGRGDPHDASMSAIR
jgi:hypothetical protein